MCGSLNFLHLPQTLEILNVEENVLINEAPLDRLPPKLEILNLSLNMFSEGLDLTSLPNLITTLHLNNKPPSGLLYLGTPIVPPRYNKCP